MRLIVKARRPIRGQTGFSFQAGPFIGPRGGKWADPQHTVAWKERAPEIQDNYRGNLIDSEMTVSQVEDVIRKTNVEHAVVWIDGEMVSRVVGHEHYVDISDVLASKMCKAGTTVFTHNHPGSAPLSVDDVYLAWANDMKEIRAVCANGRTFVLRRPGPRQWSDYPLMRVEGAKTFLQALQIVGAKAAEEARNMMDAHVVAHGGKRRDEHHPSFSPELWNEYLVQAQHKAFNALLAPSGARIEEIPAAGTSAVRPTRQGPVRDQIRASRAAEEVSMFMRPTELDLMKARVASGQLGLFGGSAQKPPAGYMPVQNSKHGGYYRLVGGKRVYWYPDGGRHAEEEKEVESHAPAEGPPTTPTREELQKMGLKIHAKSSDLFGFGYTVAEWFSPRQLAEAREGKRPHVDTYYEYIPRRPGLTRYVASTYEQQVQVHNAIGAPVKPPRGDVTEQEEMFGPAPEAVTRPRGMLAQTQAMMDEQRRLAEVEAARERQQVQIPGTERKITVVRRVTDPVTGEVSERELRPTTRETAPNLLGGRLPPNVLQRGPMGWFFSGNVTAALGYQHADGSPPTAREVRELVESGDRMLTMRRLGIETRVYASPEAAFEAARAAGVDVEYNREPGWERMPERIEEPAVRAGPPPLPPSTFTADALVEEEYDPSHAKVAPGTNLRWSGISGWLQVWDVLHERAGHHPSSAKYENRSAHASTDLSPEIAAEDDIAVLTDLRTRLREIKKKVFGGASGNTVKPIIVANEILVNNRIAELKRTTPKLSHEERHARWLERQAGKPEPRLVVPARAPKESEPGWERMPEGEKPEPRLVVPAKKQPSEPGWERMPEGERTEAVTEAMTQKKTKTKRKTDNELALEIVQRALVEKRGLTDEEAVRVAAYSGKGGISGDLNQFYTRTDIAKAMWDMLDDYQPGATRVLEPSCGSGVFLQTALPDVKVTGVELDPSAAAIAEALHGHKHSVESKSFELFTIERTGTPQNFDAVIANPPYCVRTGDIPRHKPEFRSADQYFIDTSLDHVKDGGLCVMLVHPGVMNNRKASAQEFRQRLLARAEILDAFRLPDDTFKHVHCEISADIIVMRKRDKTVGAALMRSINNEGLESTLTALGGWDKGFVEGDYFQDRPDRILGKALTAEETGWRATVEGDASKVPGDLARLTKAKIASGVKDAPAKTITLDALVELGKTAEPVKENLEKALSDLRKEDVAPVVGNVQVIAGSRYLYIGEPPKWTLMESVDDVSQIISKSGDVAVKQAHELAFDLASLIKARDEGEFYKARNMRRLAAERVKAWVAEYGIPGSHRALVQLAKSAPQLLDFIACVDSNGELSDILSKDAAVTLKPAEVDKSDLMSVANYVARRNRGYVTIGDIQHNWEGWEGQSEDSIRKSVLGSGDYAWTESGLQHLEDYLTGNLYNKLAIEQSRLESVDPELRGQVEKQIAAIQQRLETKRRSIDDIPLQLRVMGWMPLDWFNQYLNSPEGRRTVFNSDPLKRGDLVAQMVYDSGVYTLNWTAPEGYTVMNRRGEKISPEAGTVIRKTADGFDFMKYMNRLSLRKERVKDVEEHVEKGFAEWIKASPLRTELENLYNQTFNSEFRREYSGDSLDLEGMSPGITPHAFQNEAVRWAAETGRGILGQDVGLGKTFIAILLARMRKQTGQARRPMVVVPKSVATNWSEEIETLFPGSRVLVIGEHRIRSREAVKKASAEARDRGLTGDALTAYVEAHGWATASDSDEERNRKLAQIKQNEYDLIVCTKPAFDRIPLRHETIERYEKDDFWYQRAGRIDAIVGGSKTQETADKKIEKLKAAWASDKLQQKFKHTESLVYWEDLGIDTLLADEAHAYKNLYAAKSRFGKNPKFLGGSGQSKQARKMQHMSRWVRDANPSNGVYLLTATPTKNSPLEVFNMLQHVAPEAFHSIGIENSEQFIDRFCKLEERLVLTPPGSGGKKKKDDEEDESQFADEFEGAGNLEAAQCVTGFTNLKELEGIMDRYMMLQTATDVGLKIPDSNEQTHLVDMTQDQKIVYHGLREEAANLDKEEDPGGMFRILDRMKKAAQDLELFDPEAYKDWYVNSPKYKACVESAYGGAMNRGGQIIFCDHNASHERLRAMLVEKGLKPSEVGIINAQVAADSAERQRIGNLFNAGVIKVVIGNTGTMGEGVNLQGKKHAAGTTDIHHLDQPWDPGTMHQRNGRGVRQGNRAEQVNIHTYLAKGSFDGFRHSTLKGKERWLDKLRSGADNIANDMEGQGVDEIEMLAMLSDNPDAALEAIKARKVSAENAWYAKQAQESVDSFYSYQRKAARLAKLRGQEDTRHRLSTELERLKRQLLRNELLPLEIKEHLKSGDTRPVAVNTYLTGEGESARLAARMLRVGDAIGSDRHLKVIVSIGLEDRKLRVRSWGRSESYDLDVDQIASEGYEISEFKEVDELKESLLDVKDSSWRTPIDEIKHISETTLEDNQDMIDESVREWYGKHGKDRELLVRNEAGNIVRSADLAGKEIVYPWGKDRADLAAAIADANESSTHWETYRNELLLAGSREYGYNSYGSTPFSRVVKEAEAIWKARQEKAA